MPELPEVEIFRQYLVATSLKKPIVEVEVRAGHELKRISGKALARRLQGCLIKGAERHGKHLLAQLDDGAHLTLHFGMTGFLRYHKHPEGEPDHTRLRLKLTNGYYLSYSCARRLGRLGLVRDRDRFLAAMKLGPDALALERNAFLNLMQTRRGQIKAAIMDQSLIAGIGNVYSDEVLFQSRMHPRLAVQSMGLEQLGKLFQTMHRVLTTAIDRRAVPQNMPRSWLINRRGKQLKCPSGCAGVLENITAAGRSAWICPKCQPAP